MKEILIYVAKVNIYFTFFYLLYAWWFRRYTFFSLNRAYLISMTAFSLIIPQLGYIPLPADGQLLQWLPEIVYGAESNMEMIGIQVNWWQVAFLLYIFGCLLYMLKLIISLFRLVSMILHARKEKYMEYTLINSQKDYPTFSFFRYLHFQESDHDCEEVITTHELVHIRQWHSLDNLFYEVFKAFSWFNPVVYRAHVDLRNVHEFLADREVVRTKMNGQQYSDLLLNRVVGHVKTRLTIPFFQKNNLKNRVIMMNIRRSGGTYRLNYLTIFPAIALMLVANSCTDQKMDEQTTSQEVTSLPSVEEQIYSKVEQMPVFGTGQNDLYAYLGKELSYPKAAKENNIEGTVYVEFTIDESGVVTNVNLVKGVDPELDEEALRVIRNMPAWNPGKHQGKVVKVKYVMPVRFALG